MISTVEVHDWFRSRYAFKEIWRDVKPQWRLFAFRNHCVFLQMDVHVANFSTRKALKRTQLPRNSSVPFICCTWRTYTEW